MVANACRVRHLAYRTEQAYVGWVKRFILFHNKRHPSEMGASEVRAFLTHLAVNRRVAGIDAEPGAQCHCVHVPVRYRMVISPVYIPVFS